MNFIRQLASNKIVVASAIAWLSAQVLKFFITIIKNKKIRTERLWGAGGMPSAHSAMVCALVVTTAKLCAVNSPQFALALMFAFVTIYDAMGVRRETGIHAKLLNKYLNEIENEKADLDGDGIPDLDVDEIDLKEFIGHTPLEVYAGMILGFIVGMIMPV